MAGGGGRVARGERGERGVFLGKKLGWNILQKFNWESKKTHWVMMFLRKQLGLTMGNSKLRGI
jgi:uncharacterized membrane protein YbjE (DUF340 family)